jgi:hypothetical protein
MGYNLWYLLLGAMSRRVSDTSRLHTVGLPAPSGTRYILVSTVAFHLGLGNRSFIKKHSCLLTHKLHGCGKISLNICNGFFF